MADELLTFSDDKTEVSVADKKWNILIVDDEDDVHKVTHLVLGAVNILGRSMNFFDCYNAKETRDFLSKNNDIAVILLDVVMEEDDSGLKLVKFIREELKNNMVRIILRTGQPGQAPEEKVVVEYDINDYKSKTELTAEKLFTTVISSIRSYRDLLIIEKSKKGLEKIINSSANIFEIQSMQHFVSGVLMQLVSILLLDSDAVYCHSSAISASVSGENLYIMAATGKYENIPDNAKVDDVLPDDIQAIIKRAYTSKKTIVDKNHYVSYFASKNGSQNIIYLEHYTDIESWQKDLIDIFCSNVSIAFDNIYLNQELESSQREIVFTLGEIAENRSKETQNHVRRVGEYCKYIALKAGLSDSESEIIRVASAMHDIGKLAVPDSVLNKPGKLDIDEFEVIKKHALTGSNMLKHSSRAILVAASIIAGQHHEKYDGTGYPQNLKGEEIHIYARITAVADVFDALISDRCYRGAMPLDAVLKTVTDLKSSHFDPKLADILINNIDEIMEIRERNK